MKITKLSIAALAVVGFASSAMAMDLSSVTVKPYASAKLYYEATDMNGNDLFDRKSASGQALLTAGVTGKFDSCWGYGFEYMIADTLGLENILVTNTRMGYGRTGENRGGGVPALIQTQDWASQAYVTYSPCDTILSNTTFKIGRQYLDTPFAFTEKWNLAPNSFDAIVVLNQDIKNVTLVGAYVGRGNGVVGDVLRSNKDSQGGANPAAIARVTNGDRFESYLPGFEASGHGSFAVGALTNLVEGLPINLWYYNVGNVADAVWADAAYNLKIADDMSAGLGFQFGQMMPDASGAEDTTGYAVKIGGKIGNFDVMAAYSTVDEADNGLPLANTATGFKKTKLYTAAIYTDGTGVARPGSDAYKVKVSGKFPVIGKMIAQYVVCENDDNNPMHNVSELDLIYATKLAGINTKLIYMNRSIDEGKVANAGLKDDTQHVRVILSKNF